MNTPTVFVSTLSSGEHALNVRWGVAHMLNMEGILTDFNTSIVSSFQTDNRHMCTPLTVIIDEFGHFKVKNNITETEKAISTTRHLIANVHEFVRSCAP